MENNVTQQEQKEVKGKLMFQFDNDEPVEIDKLYTEQNISLSIPFPSKKEEGMIIGGDDRHVVTFKNGDKQMKIYIEKV
jgi:hypothetical protein